MLTVTLTDAFSAVNIGRLRSCRTLEVAVDPDAEEDGNHHPGELGPLPRQARDKQVANEHRNHVEEKGSYYSGDDFQESRRGVSCCV